MSATTVAASRPLAAAQALRPLRKLSLLVGLVAIAISLVGSWVPSLWGDEAASVLSATRPVLSLFPMLTHVDAVHGSYYLGLHAWIDLVGSNPFLVRLPSAIAVGACAAAVTWLCGRFGSLRFAVLAGGLAAVLPRLTYAGEEARSYAFDAAIATVICVILAEMLLRRPVTRRWWIAYGAVLAVGIYAFLYLALMAVVVGIVVFLTPHLRAQIRRWVVASGAAALVASPVIVLAVIERQQISFLAQRNVVNVDSIFVQMWFSSVPVALIAWALILLACGGWLRDTLARRRTGAAWEPRLELIALLWLIVPMGILIAASPIVAGFTARYGTYSAPAAAVLMALGVRRIARVRWMPLVAVSAICAAVVPVWISQRTPYAKNGSDWNDITATLARVAESGDAVVFDEGTRPSRRPRLAMDTDPLPYARLRDVTLKTPYAAGTSWHSSAYTVSEAAARDRFTDVNRVWLVEYSIGGATDTWGVRDLQSMGFHRVQEITDHRSVVALYER